jgi:hypothetical protein
MALQDLKSNLSNYRKPKVKVSLSQRVTPTPESFTTTPLSDKLQNLAVNLGLLILALSLPLWLGIFEKTF